MPITDITLDDLTYERSMEELKRRIPQYTKDWTDWNDSDPGITLIQLFSHLAEQVCWRLNRVPEKNHIELLKLLGVTLRQAEAATCKVAMLLEKPEEALSGTLAAGTQMEVTNDGEKLTFETTEAISTAPCEVAAIVTTKNPYINNLLKLSSTTSETVTNTTRFDDAAASPDHNEWISVRWDGKSPKLKDMPTDPVDLLPTDMAHGYLWLGLNFNSLATAGFVGVKVTLTVQYDDDEQPTQKGGETCGPITAAGEAAPTIDWLHCVDVNGDPVDVTESGTVTDGTGQMAESGAISFYVPTGIAALREDGWVDLRAAGTVDPLTACQHFGENVSTNLDALGGVAWTGDCATDIPAFVTKLQTAIDSAADTMGDEAEEALQQVVHPLSEDLRGLAGWLRIKLPKASKELASPKLRIVSFNAVGVVNRTTVTGEILGTSNGESGQTFQLQNTNIQPGTLDLQVQEGPSDDSPLKKWTAGDLDAAGASERVFEMDWEAGIATFGDGTYGMIPPAVPGLGRVIAKSYAWGGGEAGNIEVGLLKSFTDSACGITATVNFVAGSGGKDAEELADAKVRARKEISSRSRAVTAADFKFIAEHAKGVEVALAHVIPLRAPLAPGAAFTAVTGAGCGDAVPSDPDDPAGVSGAPAAGVVSVVVVPKVDGPEPTPTPSFLEKVCDHLDGYRLVTTEIHVVPPQYCRVCRVNVEVTGESGYTRSMLQDAVAAKLEKYLHVRTGGNDGKGFGFGKQLMAADLMAQVFRVEGVATVTSFECEFVRTKTDASPREGTLMMCPSGTGEYDSVTLGVEETASIVASSVTLSTVV